MRTRLSARKGAGEDDERMMLGSGKLVSTTGMTWTYYNSFYKEK